uniref:Uncharacterized protein n=1 Tax=Panagrolaimus sp. PS1159 TaxID=55785 RepID=A0AC35FQN6_9BILA
MDAKNSPRKQFIKGKFDWPGDDVLKQYFSLPSNIIYYMAMNPSTPKCYNKLIQCCKYFFEKNPIIVVKNLISYNGDESQTKICSKREYECEEFGCCVDIDIYKVTSTFWLTSELEFDCFSNNNPNYYSTLCSKIFRCDIAKLLLHEKLIYYEDFKLLASSAKEILLDCVEMTYNNEDGENVMLEKIVEACSKVKKLIYDFGGCVYALIESGAPNHAITYYGQNNEKLRILENRYFDSDDEMDFIVGSTNDSDY